MAKSGSTLGTILKWALILAVVYVIYRWWVGFSTASATTTAVSSTTPVAVAPPSSGYANPGGFFSPQPLPILWGGGPLSWYPGPPAPSPIIAAPNPNPPVLAKPGDNWWDKIWTGPVGLRSFGGPSA